MRQGGLRDAILHSAGANATHGLRRSNDDKRRAVLMLLADGVWSKWNDSKIARACAVSNHFVTKIRSEHLGEIQDSPRLVERGGTVYPIKPRASAKPADPALDAPPQPDAPPAPSPADDAGNVVVLGNRLTIMPSPGAVERDAFGSSCVTASSVEWRP